MTRTARTIVGFTLALLLLSLPGWVLRHENAAQLQERRDRFEEVEAQNAVLRGENDDLLRRVQASSNTPEAVERRARSLRLVEAGETVIVFEDAP